MVDKLNLVPEEHRALVSAGQRKTAVAAALATQARSGRRVQVF